MYQMLKKTCEKRSKERAEEEEEEEEESQSVLKDKLRSSQLLEIQSMN